MPWTELNNALAITQFYFSPSINPKNVSDSFGGTQDNGTQKYSGMLKWEDVVCGDGREVNWGHPKPRQEDSVPLHPLLNSYDDRYRRGA